MAFIDDSRSYCINATEKRIVQKNVQVKVDLNEISNKLSVFNTS